MNREWRYRRVDLADNITTITTVPCLVKGAYINTTLSAQDCEIKDSTNNAFTIPKSAVQGNAYAFGPARYEDNLIVDPDDSATGSITVIYVLLREDHA